MDNTALLAVAGFRCFWNSLYEPHLLRLFELLHRLSSRLLHALHHRFLLLLRHVGVILQVDSCLLNDLLDFLLHFLHPSQCHLFFDFKRELVLGLLSGGLCCCSKRSFFCRFPCSFFSRQSICFGLKPGKFNSPLLFFPSSLLAC